MRREYFDVGSFAPLLLILTLSCTSQAARAVDSASATSSGSDTVEPQNRLLYLDLNTPTVVQPVGARGVNIRERNFVRVDVLSVSNPKKFSVTIQIDYAPAKGTRVHLGTFSLYPSDHPGEFIVPTQGKVLAEGTIVLTLLRPERATVGDTLKLSVSEIRLTAR